MSWRSVRLGEIFDIARGGSPRPIKDFISDAADAINWISIKDASNSSKYICSTRLKIRPEGVSKSRLVHPGDFLLTNSMSFGRPYILQTTGCIHDGWLVLSDRGGVVDQDFFYHLLGSDVVYSKFAQLAAGAVVKNLNIDLVGSVEVPLPPLAEQRRIAAILDQADAIRRKRQQAIELTEELLRAAFLDMFGDPVTNPKGWPVVELDEALEGIQAGWSANGEPRSIDRTDYGVLKVSAVTSGWYRPQEHKAVAASEVTRSIVVPRKGDLLFSRANTRELVAAACMVTQTHDRVFLPDKLWRVQTKASRLLPEVLLFMLKHPRYRSEITKKATGTSGSMLNVSQAKLRQQPTPTPDMDAQHAFAELFWRTISLRNNALATTQETDALFHALVQRAFRGEL